jgi:2,4-dienoyl-CoA reductase-like NADH-dependent reductase (Old Yellow Enzyme family)
MTNPLARPLDLQCGATLSNRLAKAAMSEGLADSGSQPVRLQRLTYEGRSKTSRYREVSQI